MCATGICGLNCSVSVGGSNVADGYRWSITANAPEVEVTGFGDGSYGSYLACRKEGTIEVASHTTIAVEPGDVVDIICYAGAGTFTATNAICTGITPSSESTGIYDFTATFRITGDLSIA